MSKLPRPPSSLELAAIPPCLHIMPAGTELWRMHFQAGAHPQPWNEFRHFGPVATARFDHHLPPPRVQDRGILYAATQIITCIAEVFQEKRLVNTTRNDPWLAGFRLRESVVLLDLTGTWPTAAGASMTISSGPRPIARLWSQAIYAAYPHVCGLWYCSSMHANKPTAALYERAEAALDAYPFYHRRLSDPLLLAFLRPALVDLAYRLV